MSTLEGNTVDELKERLQCPICLENIKNISLPCGHLICSDCEDKLQNKECPMCRKTFDTTQKVFIGGSKDNYKNKYLKYKQKYLFLKNQQ
jgi:hypothetical protein